MHVLEVTKDSEEMIDEQERYMETEMREVVQCDLGTARFQYSVFHLLEHLGWVNFDLGVPVAQPRLPNSNQ